MSLISMFQSAGDSFVQLFTEMSPLVIALFLFGIVFCVIEIFIPGFGVFGIVGSISLLAAIILRMIAGGDAWMLLYMLLIVTFIVVMCFVVLAHSVKKGRLGKTAIFDVGTAVPTGKTDGTKDFSALTEKFGVAQTLLHPVGQVLMESGELVDAVAQNGFIEEGAKIKVCAVEGQKITVVKVDE